jgi:protein-disulfide isomerase
MALHLELFYSPYCSRCRKARQQVRSLAAAWPSERLQFRELDVLQELDRAVSLGVLQTPALAIDGELIAGPVPSPRALETLLRQRLRKQDSK